MKTLRMFKFFWQRRTRGWDDSDTWDLSYPIAKFTLPRIKRYREFVVDENCVAGHPGEMTHKEWIEILDKIIYSLDWRIREHDLELTEEEMGFESVAKQSYRIHEGLSLFGQHFWDLGW